MKEFFDIMAKDILSEHFTKKEYVIYGVVVPLALFVIAVLANAIERA